MPRGKTHPSTSNLSVIIPKSIHKAARLKALRSDAPSFAAYVATVLQEAPEKMSVASLVMAHGNDLLLTHYYKKEGKKPDESP